MMGIGIGLGGVAKGLESAEQAFTQRRGLDLREQAILQDRELTERALGLKQQALDQDALNTQFDQANTFVKNHLEAIKGIAESNNPIEAKRKAIAPLLDDIETLDARVRGLGGDLNVGGIRNRVDAALSVTPEIQPIGSPKEVAQAEAGLRKEFSSLSKPFREVRDAHRRVRASAKEPSAAGDLALIFNYMKILDPGSVVREGEFATAQNSAGVPDQVRNIYNQVLRGERLNVNTRNDFVDRADKLFKAQEQQHGNLTEQFKGIAKRLGVNAENVTPDFSSVQAEEEEALPERTAGGMIPPEAVRFLQANADDPNVRQQFEEKYGQSAEAFLQ